MIPNKHEEYFNVKLKELEDFIIKHNRKPTKTTNKPLAAWVSGKVKDSNKNEVQKKKVRDLLEKYGLLGRVGIQRRSWEETFSLLEKYIEEHGTDDIPKEKEKEIFGIDIKDWLNSSRTKKDKRIILEELYKKNDIQLVKKPASYASECSLIFDFIHKSKINPMLFENFKIGKQNFPDWFRTTKSYYNRKRFSQEKIEILGREKLNDLCQNDYYTEIEQLKKFNEINKNIDIEFKEKDYLPCLIIKKEKNKDFVVFEVSTKFIKTKKPSKKNIESLKDMKDISFIVSIDIKAIIIKLREVRSSLGEEGKEVLKKYDKYNLDLSFRESRFKEILLKEIGVPYLYNDYENIINILWDESLNELNNNKTNSLKKNKAMKLLSNHKKTLEEIGEEVGLSRERVRQFFDQTYSIFKNKIENKISIIKIPIYKYNIENTINQVDKLNNEEIEYTEDVNKKQKEIEMSLKNKIYYGAPGTGKSHKVQDMIGNEKSFFCMFHEEYSYFDFLGQYKPVMYKIDNGNRNTKTYNEKNELVEMYNEKEPLIVYDFIPGIFLKAYLEAKKTDEKVFLVIEEINRGDCSAIFGDLFQLLDRNEFGESKYSINTSNEVSAFLKNNGVDNYNELKIPSNLHIISTMNTSDQSLFNMDSAFKRRWDMFFVDIDYNEKNLLDVKIENTSIKWLDFLEKLNDLITETLESENKCLGQWFVKPQNRIISESQLKNKIIHYLYFDVFHNERQEIFKELKYSNIIKKEVDEIIKNILDEDYE